MAEDFEQRRQKKIIRSLLRLKHSLAADAEIEATLRERERLLGAGEIPTLTVDLADIVGEQ